MRLPRIRAGLRATRVGGFPVELRPLPATIHLRVRINVAFNEP